MSKNLEEEYLREIQNDVPDLWGRINAGIDKLEESKDKEEPSRVTPVNLEAEPKADNAKKRGKKRGVIALVSVLSAAAILFIVFVPVALLGIAVIFGNNAKLGNGSAEMSMAETTDSATYYEDAASDGMMYEEEMEEAEEPYYEYSNNMEDMDMAETGEVQESLDSDNKIAALTQGDQAGDIPRESEETYSAAIPEGQAKEEISYVKGDLIAKDVLLRVDIVRSIDGMNVMEVTVLEDFKPETFFATDVHSGECMIVKSDDEKLWDSLTNKILTSDTGIVLKVDMYVDESGLNEYPLVYLKSE
ncbi:MAG: hypothetical protein K5659_00505 [Lachnospiraceae bacterium]|nr:hypothetical protein [Lachnospiraceae bacterium]